jgi:hypothetical protein
LAFAVGGLLLALGTLFGLERLVHADVKRTLDSLPQSAPAQPTEQAR